LHTHRALAPCLVLCGLFLAGFLQARAQSTAEELVHEEEVRARVADALKLYQSPAESGAVRNDNLVRAVYLVADIGPDAVPFVVNELNQAQTPTFLFSAYSLGLIGTPEAEKALREAVESADATPGAWGELRKAFACWALTLMGRADALALMNEGQHRTSHTGMHAGMSVLEAGALMTGYASTPYLLAELERFNDDSDPQHTARFTALKGLGRVADPAALPTLLRALTEDDLLMRRELGPAIGGFDSPEAIGALLTALGDDDLLVRRGATIGLKQALPLGRLDPVVERLRIEDSAILREQLYEIIARAGGPAYTDLLVEQWGHEDPLDRAGLVAVLPSLDPKKARPMLQKALDDPDALVHAGAVRMAARDADPTVRQWLVEAVLSPFWTLAQPAIDALADQRVASAAGTIAHRLIDIELAGVVTDPRQRLRVEKLGDALVALRDASRLGDLRESAARQQDGTLVQYLDRTISKLTTIEQLGTKQKRWIEALGSPDADTRLLAYDYLGRRGTDQAVQPLVDSFPRVEQTEGVEILRALARFDTKTSRELVTRVLQAPEFAPIDRAPLRNMAAWTARRIGPDMYPVLLSAVERRDGRDTLPLLYLAVLGEEQAIPVLDRYRPIRMRYIAWNRGKELDRLDWIRRQLAHGLPVEDVDVPPEDITF